ncbi:hypothetical protein I4U23_017452 [Adineta vaga]|nr:hypothetical protein I4U23_017452 [Adineta vaga]
MEGILYKWTNYYNGWQPRYFVLNETGVLSYYKSKELIHEGCKGSCLVLACEVKAHPNDPLRFDLIIPGEQFFCLKAKSQPERQRWLVSLGTCKSRGTKSTTTSNSNSNHNNTNTSSTLISHLTAIDRELKIKVQELRLYETVLTQGIHAIKSIANDTPIPDVKKLDESSSMLSVTCDAFIHTLDECVKLATGDSSQSLLLLSPSPPKLPDGTTILRKSFNEFETPISSNLPTTTTFLPKQIVYKTFFTQLPFTFAQLSCLPFKDIHSELFLSTCEQYLTLIDKFNSTTFTPLRADANGNISKLRRKISNDPNKFQTLFSILNDEINAKTTKEKNSATDALLWLKRSIAFLSCFLHEFGQGDRSVEDAMNKAYGQTLKRYHGWITRGAFSIALRSVPYNEDFLVSLSVDSNDAREVLFEQQILHEMLEHSSYINNLVHKITEFYLENELESDEITKENQNILLLRKQRRQLERKLDKAKRNAWHEQKKNIIEDANIKKLEKLLGIKPVCKTYLRDFIDDVLDSLLNFCDKDRRKEISHAEGDGRGIAWYDEEETSILKENIYGRTVDANGNVVKTNSSSCRNCTDTAAEIIVLDRNEFLQFGQKSIISCVLEIVNRFSTPVWKLIGEVPVCEQKTKEIIEYIIKYAQKVSMKENQNTLLPRKQRRQLERKLVKAKRNAWHHRDQIPKSIDALAPSFEQEENSNKKKKKKKKKKKESKDDSEELTVDEQAAKEHHRRHLLEDNEMEDGHIKKLEKLLGIKSNRKTYLRGFVDDGLDFLLDFCDKDRRKEIMQAEGDGEGNAWYDEEDEDQQWLAKKQKEKVKLANDKEKSEEKISKKKTSLVKFNEDIQTKMIDDDDDEDEDFDEEDFDEDEDGDGEEDGERGEDEEETPTLKEDIYGRTVDTKGNVVKSNSSTTYIPPALRQKLNTSDDNSLLELKRRLQGQINRLSEKNLSSILIEIETIYRTQSRATVNLCLYQLYHDSLISSLSLTGENFLAEYALLACLLHANIGLEIGSYLLENFLQLFVEHIHDDVSNKIPDNLIQFFAYTYAFSMINGKILFDLARYILTIEQINEKRLELILLLLKTSGFFLRKDNPLELKNFLQELRTICSSSTLISSSSKRLEFMMDTIKSLKNNDVRKLPGGFEPDRIDRLRKIYRNLVKDKTVQQANMLNVGLEDFLNAKEQGRWWIVGSAWQKQNSQDKQKNKKDKTEPLFNENIRKLAKQQHMNTDIRRLIFGTLLTSEDCDDAVEKLHKLNLNKIQEREIIHVTIHCSLHEKTYNPYYTLILQRFAAYDRRFQMSLQYHTWDRFKDLSLLNDHQLANFGTVLSQLLISKSITLNIFKNFNFIELTTSARTFLVELFVKLFENTDDASLQNIFQFPLTKNYKFVRDALRLFLSHFISKKSIYSDLVHRRCQIAINELSKE